MWLFGYVCNKNIGVKIWKLLELQEILVHGKSTVCKEFLKCSNAKVIDADAIAKSLDFPGSPYLDEIMAVFGKDVLNKEGTLNRKILGNIIYNDLSQKQKLDKITFPYIVKRMEEEIDSSLKAHFDYILIDAPLLFEAEINSRCDVVIAVLAKEENKMNRICKRDNVSLQVAKSRLTIQQTDAFFKQNSDFIIENNGDLEEIRKEVERILESI